MSTNSILLIDDDCDTLLVISEHCRQMGLHVRCAHNLLTALAMVETQLPDLICIDVQIPSGNGLRFCEMLASDAETKHIPVIVLTRQRDEATVETCERIKAHYVPKRPDVWTGLRPLIAWLLNDRTSAACQPPRGSAASTDSWPAPPDEQPAADSPLASVAFSRMIVVADDEREVVNLLTERFTRLGCSVIGVTNAAEAVNVIYRTLPDLVCIDVNMPAGNGLSVCEMMISDGLLRSIPAILLTDKSDKETFRRCYDMMIYYVQKGGDMWGRMEPLARGLLGLVDPRLRTASAVGSPPASICAASTGENVDGVAYETD